MKSEIAQDIMSQIVEKATEFGASLAGIADVRALKKSPSHFIYGKLDSIGNPIFWTGWNCKLTIVN